MQYGKNEDLKKEYTTGCEEPLKKEADIKDLGVYVSENMSFETHICDAVKKGRKYLGWILRSFKSRKPEVIITLFQSYVIPRLEYSSTLWSPYQIKDITKIEAIQRTVTDKVEGVENMNYHQRLRALKLYSLQRRRERYMACYMYKVASGLVPNNVNFQFYSTSRHGVKCRQPKIAMSTSHISTIRKNFFTSSGPAIFNVLPCKIKEAETLSQFKSRLDAYLQTVPDLPPTPGYPSLNRNIKINWKL